MTKKNEYNYIWTLLIIFIGAVFIIAIVASCIFCKTSWDWGSFIGGAIGGIGTLIAVSITTWQTRNIQMENRNSEELRSTLIVYYDLRFALLGIFNFADKLFTSFPNINTQDIDKRLLDNIYLDKEWIHTVAKVSTELSSEEIGQVYNSYGKIFDLLDCVNTKNDYDNKDIETIKNYVETFYTKSSGTIVIQKEIKELITNLEFSLSKDYNKCVGSTLIDELIKKGCEVQ